MHPAKGLVQFYHNILLRDITINNISFDEVCIFLIVSVWLAYFAGRLVKVIKLQNCCENYTFLFDASFTKYSTFKKKNINSARALRVAWMKLDITVLQIRRGERG